jgi:iron(III) transport system substrate-binding protein
VAGARQEGTLNFYTASTLKASGALQLQQAFNKQYGLNITVHYTPSASMTGDTAKVITQTATGAPPSWDLMVMTDAQVTTLATNGMMQPFPWSKVFKGTAPSDVYFDNGALAVAAQIILPAYNTNLVKGANIPRTWQDLLNPMFKGKIGVSSATHHWARLAQVWGIPKATAFVKQLAAQKPVLGRLGAISNDLQLGQIDVAASLASDQISQAMKAGAPIAFDTHVQPVVIAQFLAAPLKGAAHPDAARLFAEFLRSPAGQKIWIADMGEGLLSDANNPFRKYYTGKQLDVLNSTFALHHLGHLTKEYGQMLGYK